MASEEVTENLNIDHFLFRTTFSGDANLQHNSQAGISNRRHYATVRQAENITTIYPHNAVTNLQLVAKLSRAVGNQPTWVYIFTKIAT